MVKRIQASQPGIAASQARVMAQNRFLARL
jgi:hypothetical protein